MAVVKVVVADQVAGKVPVVDKAAAVVKVAVAVKAVAADVAAGAASG